MWNGNYLTFEQFMAEVHDRYRFLEHELSPPRIKEWTFKAMGLIGVLSPYISKILDLTLLKDPDMTISYVQMPDGIIQLNGITDDCGRALIKSNALKGWNDTTAPPSYQLNGSLILTNLPGEAVITLSFDSFPVDDEGSPLIPDETVFLEAMLAYNGYRMGYELWMMDRLVEAKYRELEREWLFYVNSAKTKLLMPSYDEAQSLANQLKRGNQSPYEHATQFKYLNSR